MGAESLKVTKPCFANIYRSVSRCDADVAMKNIFKVFDTSNCGVVDPRDLIVAFTMGMRGTSKQLPNTRQYTDLVMQLRKNFTGPSRNITGTWRT